MASPETSRFTHLLRAELAELEAYVPHPGAFEVRLDGNEAPSLLSQDARDALAEAMIPRDFQRYPDPRAVALREAIAARAGVTSDEVLAGVGSDEVIALLLSALDRPRERAPNASIVTVTPTFVMYRLSAKARGFKVVEVPLDASWDLDVNGMRRAIEMARPNLVFVATPNNPTGGVMAEQGLRAIIEAASDALVVIDEAYVDFARKSSAHLYRDYPNVALLGTLSKIGFASIRVGWLIGAPELVREIDKIRQPYNLPVPSQHAATFVLRNLKPEIDKLSAYVIAERERLKLELDRLGFSVAPSEANFLWVETRRPAAEVFEGLASCGILVRSFHARGGRLARRLRITVGLSEENDRLLDVMSRWT